MRTHDLDYLDSLPSFEPIHAIRALEDDKPARIDRAKPRGKKPWRKPHDRGERESQQ